jgi:hypothetical protein
MCMTAAFMRYPKCRKCAVTKIILRSAAKMGAIRSKTCGGSTDRLGCETFDQLIGLASDTNRKA